MLQRPLTGEPLPVDLLNTRWFSGGRLLDLLDDPSATAEWLTSWELAVPEADLAEAVETLRRTRAALGAHVAAPEDPAAAAAVSAVLGTGRLRLRLGTGGPLRQAEAPPAALPAWEAARRYLDLLQERPGRIRRCANDECVLHFVDTSPRGARRWCSMAGCGNRLKARRHHARTTGTGTGTGTG
ncbi:CGNR zinc finger domain-containing protein [Kineococcus sp. NUM-3379]